MEKIIMPVWKYDSTGRDAFKRQLLNELGKQLAADAAVKSVRVCIADEFVDPASSYRMVNIMETAFDAVIILWIDAASQLTAHSDTLQQYLARYIPYVVTESDRLPIDDASVSVGKKMDGMNQIVLLQKPDKLTYEEWLTIWQDSHTQVAIDTQSTYGYKQNVVVRGLVDDAPRIGAIVEENFPEKAIHSRLGFYDADENEELCKQREREMFESCNRFIDFNKIDCIPTSEYVMK